MSVVKLLNEREYPGRGIIFGAAKSGEPLLAYFIMGRSESSRTRVMVPDVSGVGIKTVGAETPDPLTVYRPVRLLPDAAIVSNGSQTDTIYEYLQAGGSVEDALRKWDYEPDAPIYTPRISGVLYADGSHRLSIVKQAYGGSGAERFFFEYGAPEPQAGHFISTYEGCGGLPQAFTGEPIRVTLPDGGAEEIAEAIWESMNADNRVALYIRAGGPGDMGRTALRNARTL